MRVLSELQKIFPPPRYMTLPSAGVDMSDTSVKYMHLSGSHIGSQGVELAKWGELELPEGVIVEGEVQDVGKLATILQEVRKQCGVPYIRLSLPEEHAYIFETDVKRDMPQREVRGLLEFKLQENVPISPREAFFDYDVVTDSANEGSLHTIVTVYGKTILNKYYDACVRAGLTPLSFEVESQALARAVVPKKSTDATLVVDFGKTHTGIGIVHRDTLMYTSAIGGSGDTMSKAMRGVLGNEVAEKELTVIKNTQGLRGGHGKNDVRQALVGAVDKMAAELQSHIRYWNAREGSGEKHKVAQVVLSGGSANLAGLPEYLSGKLAIPVKRADVWQNVFDLDTFVPPIDRHHSYGYATTIGLALINIIGTEV